MCSGGTSVLEKSDFPTYNTQKTCKSCVQLCFSPNNTLYLHHVLIHYSLLLTVILTLLRISLGVNLKLYKTKTPNSIAFCESQDIREYTDSFVSVMTIDINIFIFMACPCFWHKYFHNKSLDRLTLNTQHGINPNSL